MFSSLFWSSVGMAFDTLRSYKLRSFLTVLGVIIGTGTIIGVGSIITGMDAAFANAMRTFGSDTMVVFKFAVGPRFGNRSAEERMRKPITFEQAQAIRERCPHVDKVTAGLLPWRGVQKIRYQANDYAGLDMWGADSSYADVWQVELIHGRFFSEIDNQHRARVVVLGEDVWKGLFASSDPSGKWVDVEGQKMEVIGVMKKSSAGEPGGRDNRLVMPYWSMRKFQPAAEEHMLFVKPMKGQLPAAMDEVRGVLRQERRVKYDERRMEIITQFMTEAVVLTFLGGLLGMAVGWLIPVLGGFVFPELPMSVPLWAAGTGVVVSVGIGLFFGIWPANKAARLDPVEALRYE
ncbi:MAG: ABC transporter permease [Acidobacteria bacterium]|nr:ABC transporter permease [Acidobacteriota bacterium]